MSETTPGSLNAALAALQGKLPRITKDLTAKVKSERTGAQYTYNYADLSLISREVLPLLSGLGLAFIARPTLRGERFVLAYELRHTSFECIEGEYPLPDRGTPQEIGSAITYARRYCLCAVTGLAPDDDDHDAIVAEKAARRQRREPKPRTTAAPSGPPMDAEQQATIQSLFLKLNMGPQEREARLSYATKVVGRPLKSATEMSHEEAAKVIAHAEKELAERAGDA